MRVVSVTEKNGRSATYRLHHLTDLHVGAPDFDETAFRERRKLIEQDPLARWTMGGDGGDLIRHNDPRYEPGVLDKRYRVTTDIRHASREHLVELFHPIREKCWGWCDGNHEAALDKYYGGHFGVEVCCDLGIEDKFVGYRGFVRVTFNAHNRSTGQLIDIQHGWQSGRLKGAPAVQAERELGTTMADIVLRGHNHMPYGQPFRTFDVTTAGNGRPKIITRARTVINGGSWRRGWSDLEPVNPKKLSEVEKDQWGERSGRRPEPIGGPVLLLSFRSPGAGTPTVEHTLVQDTIDEHTLGMAA